MSKSKLYKDKIIDHYKNPRNFEEVDDADLKAHVANSVCGDEITVYLMVKDGEIIDAKFKGSGCAICLAGMSMLSEKLVGKTVSAAEGLNDEIVLDMLGMDKRSPRLKCAVLGLEAVKRAVRMEGDDPCDFC